MIVIQKLFQTNSIVENSISKMRLHPKYIFIYYMIQFISISSGQWNVQRQCDPPGTNFTKIYVENCHLKVIEIQQKQNLIEVFFRQRLSWLDHRIVFDASNPLSFKAYTSGGKKECLIWFPNVTRTEYVEYEKARKP